MVRFSIQIFPLRYISSRFPTMQMDPLKARDVMSWPSISITESASSIPATEVTEALKVQALLIETFGHVQMPQWSKLITVWWMVSPTPSLMRSKAHIRDRNIVKCFLSLHTR